MQLVSVGNTCRNCLRTLLRSSLEFWQMNREMKQKGFGSTSLGLLEHRDPSLPAGHHCPHPWCPHYSSLRAWTQVSRHWLGGILMTLKPWYVPTWAQGWRLMESKQREQERHKCLKCWQRLKKERATWTLWTRSTSRPQSKPGEWGNRSVLPRNILPLCPTPSELRDPSSIRNLLCSRPNIVN